MLAAGGAGTRQPPRRGGVAVKEQVSLPLHKHRWTAPWPSSRSCRPNTWLWVRAALTRGSARGRVLRVPLIVPCPTHLGTQARTLSAGCERLVSENDRLCEFAAALRSKLAVFEQLDSLAVRLHTASVSPGAAVEHLPPLLRDADACLAFCSRHPQYAEAQAYGLRFQQLHSRGLAALRGAASALLRRACAQAAQAASEAAAAATAAAVTPAGEGGTVGTPQAAVLPTDAEAAAVNSALYVRFRAVLGDLVTLLAYPQSRAAAGFGEYVGLMEDVRALYTESRSALMAPHAAAQVQRLLATCGEDACALARWGADSLLSLAADEADLWAHVFNDARPGDVLPLMEQLAVPLGDALRLASLRLRDLDSMADLVEALRSTMVHTNTAASPGAGAAAMRYHPDTAAAALPPLARALADARERLAFLAHTYLRQHVAGYTPRPEDAALILRTAVSPAPGPGAAMLYPPVGGALACLSRLYGAVETDTFGGLAQEAVTAAVAAVHAAAVWAASSSSEAGRPLDCYLFEASQLLSLRDQVAPFDAEFVVTQRALDLSSMRGVVRRILASGGGGKPGDGPLALGGPAPGGLNQAGGPMGAPMRTVEAQLDGRLELERALKAACEAFILAVTKAAVEPLLSFLAKAAAVRGGAGQLKAQAFAAPARLTELVGKCAATTTEALRDAASRTRVYLPAPQVAAVLLRPVKANIAEAHAQLAALLDEEFSPPEVAAVRLTPPEELRRMLDAACEVTAAV